MQGNSNVYDVTRSGLVKSCKKEDLTDAFWLDIKKFVDNRQEFEIKVLTLQNERIELTMKGIDLVVGDAMKKVAMDWIPTMAIDRIDMHVCNTESKLEEYLDQLPLIPFAIDPALFVARESPDEQPTGKNAVKFEYSIKCRTVATLAKSDKFKWIPIADQDFSGDNVPRPVVPDIAIDVLRPGDELSFTAFCFKGVGHTHLKFSPSVNAVCRMVPNIKLHRRFVGEDASSLKKLFTEGVIEIIRKDGEEEAVVARPEICKPNSNYLRVEGISVSFKRNHFYYTVKGLGTMPPEFIFAESLKILVDTCGEMIDNLLQL